MPNANVNKVVYNNRTLIDISDTTAGAAQILQGYGAYGADGAWIDGTASSGGGGGGLTGMYNIVATNNQDGTQNLAIVDANGNGAYDITVVENQDGTQTLLIVDAQAASINLQNKTVTITPSETAKSQTVTADSGYDGLGEVEVNVGAISSSYVGSGVTRRSSSDLTASGATVNVPSGYYSSAASKSVASGTEGTPTATKGTVSNHSVTITPSVTNSAGYISGGTHSGSGVSVSASELVSGTLPVTESGIYDVTNYETVNVNVSGKAFQFANEGARVAATTYTATDVSLTVEKSGTYTISWSGFRNTTSGTSGSQLYVNGSAVGSAFTTFSDSYWQAPKLTGQSLNAGDVLVVRARSRATNYYMCVANLVIEEE